MRIPILSVLPFIAISLAGCGSAAEQQADAAGDRVERQAEQNAATAGNAVAALGMTERQLLDADLRAVDGADLGDVELVRRDASGAVTGFLVELEDSNPDRLVEVPLAGLTARPDGNDMDIVTTMTAQQLAALPDAQLPAR